MLSDGGYIAKCKAAHTNVALNFKIKRKKKKNRTKKKTLAV